MRVREAMTRQLTTADPDDPAQTVAELLVHKSLTGLPVVDAAEHVVGVITEQDLIAVLRQGQHLQRFKARDLMSKYPILVKPDTELEEAASMLEEWRVRRLPVCEEGHLVGLISRGDVLRALLEND